MGINRDAKQGYPLDVIGPVRFSSSCSALSYTTTSDARVKTDVVPVSLDECARLAKVISPMTYLRTDLESTDRRMGYIANHWNDALGSGMRNIWVERSQRMVLNCLLLITRELFQFFTVLH